MTQTLEQQDMHAFTYMTDTAIDQVLSSSEVELNVRVAKEIVKRVKARDVYTIVGDVLIPPLAKLRVKEAAFTFLKKPGTIWRRTIFLPKDLLIYFIYQPSPENKIDKIEQQGLSSCIKLFKSIQTTYDIS